MKKVLIFVGLIIILLAAVILGIRLFSGEDNWICQNGERIRHGNPKADKPLAACGAKNIPKEDTMQPKTPEEESNIVVSSPVAHEKISSPLDIQGKARVFENVVSIRLKDAAGKILFQGTAMADSPDVGEFGAFEKQVQFTLTESTEGTLEIYESSAKDGSEINKVTIPVQF
jgi:germination protein M